MSKRRGRRLALGTTVPALAAALALAGVLAGTSGQADASAASHPRPRSHRGRACARHYRARVAARGHTRGCPRRRTARHLAPTAPTAGSSAGQQGLAPALAPVSSAPTAPPEAAAPPAPAPPPSVPHVAVTAVEYGLTLSRTSVPAGKVVLQLINHGQDEHNLNAALPETPPDASLPNTLADATSTLTVELRPGLYTLFCSLPEHERRGMHATLTVE